ncbi:MAG: hypothetical protein AB1705_27900 [Verrucomicrobiota bacterium]
MEALHQWEFLSCCAHDDAVPHQESDCQDACAVIEAGLYKSEKSGVALPVLLVVLDIFTATLAELPADSAGQSEIAGAPPPELPKAWQFIHRAAAPPRAPSFAS